MKTKEKVYDTRGEEYFHKAINSRKWRAPFGKDLTLPLNYSRMTSKININTEEMYTRIFL